MDMISHKYLCEYYQLNLLPKSVIPFDEATVIKRTLERTRENTYVYHPIKIYIIWTNVLTFVAIFITMFR